MDRRMPNSPFLLSFLPGLGPRDAPCEWDNCLIRLPEGNLLPPLVPAVSKISGWKLVRQHHLGVRAWRKQGGNKWMEHLMWYYKAQTLGKPEMRVRWQSVVSFQYYGLSSPPFGTCSLTEDCSQLWDCLLAWPLDRVGIEQAHPVMIAFFLTIPCPCMKRIQDNA